MGVPRLPFSILPVPVSPPRLKQLALSTVRGAGRDDVPSLAAALAYYTVFSLPPLLAVVVWVAGAVYGPEAIAARIEAQAASTIGPGAGAEIGAMLDGAGSLAGGLGAKLIGLLALVLGATGAFGQLQKALNRAWNVEDAGGGLREILLKRLLSFGMVVTLAFFLLASLVLSTALSALSAAAADVAGSVLAGLGGRLLDLGLSLAVITGLFAVLFRVLPDAEIAWRDVWVGALATAVLFTVGKTVLGVYLAHASPGSAFGAAGSLALLLVWIYYSALIVLVGAEFTQAWAEQVGAGIEPDADETDLRGPAAHPLGEPRDPAPY